MSSSSPSKPRIIVGISGASGVIYGIQALKTLRELEFETHLVVSKSALVTLSQESPLKAAELFELADVHYANSDIGACIASGSFQTIGMLIAPCSIKTLSEVATGVTSSLLSRAADVVLKERRKLVLMVRETPLHAGHLESMLRVTNMGAIVTPPVPAFYTQPETIDDIVCQSIGRALDLFNVESGLVKRWTGNQPRRDKE
ncbi:MAG: UbiX family flavin prenyltransferase [Gammaproteobacteria bacterium]|jgi:4-hydroxy-3-polyprenylbenzoate decarboxylase|nr:UbiX family flavin prenyltransferase [Gammaproteobacteria bacterium]MBT6043565.1 UbiX family flavin prenyltransferase [Gammaproteobacteria bacterium]